MSLRVRTERDSAEGAGTGESKGLASNRLYRRLAWGISSLSLALVVIGLALIVVGIFNGRNEGGLELHQFFIPVLAITFSLVGSIVASRHWRNPIGWIFIVVGFSSALDLAAPAYASLSQSGAGQSRLPGVEIAQWLDTWLWLLTVLLPFTFLLLLFPHGRLPSPRWRPIAWSAVLGLAASFASIAFQPGPMGPRSPETNPFGIDGAAAQLAILQDAAALFLTIGLAGSIAALVVRFRRSRGIEREQIKWLVYAVILGILVVIVASIPSLVRPKDPILYNLDLISIALALAGIAAAAGIAIMRYRLYEVDLIVNRTLVYGTLSAGIVITYIFLVGLFGALLNVNVNLAAGLVTVVLTALLFQPLRTRLRSAVNRVVHVEPMPVPNPVTADPHAASEMRRRPLWLVFAYAAWFAWAALALFILLAAIPLGYAPYVGKGAISSSTGELAWYLPLLYLVSAAVSLLVASISFALATLLFWKKRNELIALLLSSYLLAYGVLVAGPVELSGGFRGQPYSALISTLGSVWFFAPILLLYLFPSGRFVPRWSRWAACLLLLLVAIVLPDTDNFSALTNPKLYVILFVTGCLVGAGIYAQIYRYRRAATSIERQQVKWVAFGLSFYLILLVVTSIPYLIVEQMPAHRVFAGPAWSPIGDMIWWLLMSISPLTLAVAVMRYRVWDIDIIINRTLVFGALTAGVIGLYILLVGALGAFSQTSGNLLISLLATGLIAVLFQPLRERLQRGVNRLLYGERDEPYALMARLGQNLETTIAPDAILLTLVRTIAQALKLPYVAIETGRDGRAEIVAAHGEPVARVQRVPLAYQAETVGNLLVGPRSPNDPLSPADLNLLRIIAQQAGMAVHAVQLTEDLQRSRERLVVAREEERRRIRRDLHDGLGPVLASLAMQADNAREWTEADPSRAETALADITAKAQAALQDIRRLVYDLRPAALDELGLVGALRQTAANVPNGVHIEIDASEPLPQLSAAVEVAAFRIAQETLNNVLRHSHAQHCVVRISALEELRLEVSDDGVGLPTEVHAGVGLISMRERALELGGSCVVESERGGGTRVLARLPLGHHLSENG